MSTCCARGIDLITWTYDPLLARNVQLNIAKLGAVCNTYLANLYGEMRDGLNAGLPSDRFQLDWWIATRRVADRLGYTPGDRPRSGRLVSGRRGPAQPARTRWDASAP